MNRQPPKDWQVELMPYFEVAFIYGFGICESCAADVSFNSPHPKFTDEWWFDEAKAMKDQGWVVPKVQSAYCAKCAKEKNVKHNPKAYDLTSL